MLLRALLTRPVRRSPVRLTVTVLGVAAGIAAVVATVASSRAAVASLRQGVAEIAGRARLEVAAPSGIDDGILANLRPLADEAVIAPVVEEVALAPALSDAVRVLGIEPLVDRGVRDLTIEGTAADAALALQRLLRGEGVLLARPLADRLGLGVGGRLTLLVRSRPVSLEVLGLVRPRRFASAWDRVVIADVARVQELFGLGDRLDRIELVPRGGVPVAALRARAEALLPAGVAVTEPAARGEQTGRMVRALEFNLTALSGVSLFVGAVLVATALATSVVQRRAILALAVSLGATRRQIARVVLAEAVAIGALGGSLGVAGGIVGARAALASVRSTVAAVVHDAPAAAITLPPWLAVAGLLLGIAVSLAAAALPLVEAVRTPPIQSLRAERPVRLDSRTRRRTLLLVAALALLAAGLARLPAIDDLPIAALLGSLLLLGALLAGAGQLLDVLSGLATRVIFHVGGGTPVRVAGAALAAGRRRAAWAAGAVGVAVGLAVAIATMVHSFRTTVEDWTRQAMRSDIWVRPVAASTGMFFGRLDPELVRIADRLFGADEVDPFYTTDALVDGRPVTLGGGAMSVVARHGGVPFRDGRDSRDVFAAAVAHHAAVVNEPFARRFGVSRGGLIRIQVGRKTVERRVEGVFHDYSRHLGLVVLEMHDYLSLYPDEGPREIAVFLPPGADPEAARERFRRAVGGRFLVDMLLNGELRREVMAIFDRTFAITSALQAVAAGVAVLAVLTVLFTLVSERRRELAVLRAVGASPLQVVGVVAAEAGLLGVAGSAGGLGAGLLVGLVLVKVVNLQSFGWSLRFLPPWTELAATAVWVAAACLVAGLAPAWTAARNSPREGLREEG
jgi:putative ABC transport system permease protein